MKPVFIDDVVLLFGEYEGVLLEIKDNQVIVYCPTFDEAAPYVVTDIENIIALDTQNNDTGLLN